MAVPATLWRDDVMIRLRWLPVIALLIGIGLMGAAPPAEGAFRIRIEQIGAGTGGKDLGVVITDNAAGDTDPTVGSIQYSGSIGVFSITVTIGLSKPVTDNAPNYGEIHLTNVSVNASGAGVLRVTLEDTDFTDGPDGPLVVRNRIGGALGDDVTIISNGYVNPDNLVPDLGADTGATPTDLDPFPGPPGGSVGAWDPDFEAGPGGGFGGNSGKGFTKSGSYSLFNIAVLEFAKAGQTASFDSATFVTPAPSGIIALLSGVPVIGLGGWFRFRRRK